MKDMTFGYKKPLNLIVRDNMLKDSEMFPIWAAYFNMARCNYFNTLDFIANSVGLGDGENMENRIFKMKILNVPLTPEVELKVKKMLFQHFPFLTWISSNKLNTKDKDGKSLPEVEIQEQLLVSLSDMRQCLKNLSYTLSYFRNHYSHSRSVETRSEEKILQSRKSERQTGLYLKKLTTVSARIIKERFSGEKNSVQKGMLNDSSLNFITDGKIKFITLKDEKGRTLFDDRGKKRTEAVDNENYFLNPLQKPVNDTIVYDRLSQVGKLMLVCLFLEKKYITEFLMQAHFLQAFNEKAEGNLLSDQRVLLEVMSALRFRSPKRKVDSTVDSVQVALDMLNELKKCPEELYELLGNEDRAQFNVMSSTGEPVLLRRSSDRFTQLALQWFDVNKALKSVRFQINAGVFRYLFNDSKLCIDGNKRLRVLQEPLNGFGRIQEVEELREKQKAGEDGPWPGFAIKGFGEIQHDDIDCLPYINDARTRYLIDGDNIGLRFSTDGDESGDYLPTIEKTDTRYRTVCKPAQAIISRFELPAMLFLHLRRPGKEGDVSPVEKIIMECVANFQKLFSDVRDGVLAPEGLSESALAEKILRTYGIKLSDVPEKICDYLLARVKDNGGFKAYKKRVIESLQEQTEYRIQRLKEDLKAVKSDMNKPGKPGYVQIRPGSLAGFIAKDIILFQEGSASQKMTGLNFSVMQGTLATFGSYECASVQDLETIFKAAGLITPNGSCGTHPFLAAVMASAPRNTIELYKKYLLERQKYLSGNIPDTAPFLHAERACWAVRDEAFYRAYAGRCLERPVMLPRQLFEAHIKDSLLKLQGEKAAALQKNIMKAGEHCNTAFMINRYFEDYFEDYPQTFYGVHVEEFDGEMDHRYGHRFFVLVRKYIREASIILEKLKSSKEAHSVYIRELERAIKWAKSHPIPEAAFPKRKPSTPKPSFDEISKKLKGTFKAYMDTEKTLRRYVVQDELLFLAAMESIKSTVGTPADGEWMLCDIGPKGESILDCEYPSVSTRATFTKIIRDNDTHEVKKPIHVPVTIEQRNVKLKDYGDVFKLLHDNRLESLLESHKGEVILAEELEEELKRYDERRVGIFKDIMEYEKRVTNGVSNKELCDAFSAVDSKTLDFKVMMHFDNENDALTKEELRQIRNAFCHNAYPPVEVYTTESGKRETRVIHEADVPGTAITVSERATEISMNTSKR